MRNNKNALKKSSSRIKKGRDSELTGKKTVVFSMDAINSNREKLSQTMSPNLVMIYGPKPDVGKHWPLKKNKIFIGRDQKNDICIHDASVSKSHLVVHKTKNKVAIMDQGSTNGTFLNDKKQPPRKKVGLNDNDALRMGNIVLKFLDRGNLEIFSIIDSFKKAFYDNLTGAGNRVMLESAAPRLFRFSQTKNGPFAIIVFDIDHFKRVNDTYGHLAGDFILKKVSALAKNCFRQKDLFARVGGEEFCLVLDVSLARAKSLIESLRKKVAKEKFLYKGRTIRTSLSGGVARRSKEDQDWLTVYERADQALYKAKTSGRNKVCVNK